MMSSDEFKRRRAELADAARSALGGVRSDARATRAGMLDVAADDIRSGRVAILSDADASGAGGRVVSGAAAVRPVADVHAVTNAAIDRVERGAAPEWLDAARAAIRRIANAGGTFTADDVWAALDRAGVAEPNEPRAMGAALRAAKTAGEIVRAGGYKAGTRPRGHGHPISIWIRKGAPR